MSYKGYIINYVTISNNEYFVVDYDGDDVVFDSEEDARLFIDCVG